MYTHTSIIYLRGAGAGNAPAGPKPRSRRADRQAGGCAFKDAPRAVLSRYQVIPSTPSCTTLGNTP